MSQYSVGTVSFVNNSAVVVGAGTQWSTQLAANQLFALKGSTIWYQILSIQSDTQLTLTSVYAGPTAAAQSYVAQRDFTATRNYPTPTFGDVQSASLIANTMLQLETELTTMSAAAQAMNGSITVEGSLIVSGTGFAFDDVPITGSTIDSTTIGATTPAAGTFTAVSISGGSGLNHIGFGSWQGWNVKYVGGSSGWIYDASSYGYAWSHQGNSLNLYWAVTGTAGATATLVPALKISGDTGVVSFPSGAVSPSDWQKNRIINGGFDIWQEGTSRTLSNFAYQYVADQWIVYNGTGVAVGVQQTSGFSSTSSYHGVNIFATGCYIGGYISIEQRFEGSRLADLAGKSVTVSFDIETSASAGTVTAYAQWRTNTALDNGTFSNYSTGISFTPNGRVSLTFSPAQTANLQLGSSLIIAITQNGAVGNLNCTIGGVTLEKGVVGNAYVAKPITQEWIDCERFFQTSYDAGVAAGTYPITTGYIHITEATTNYPSVQCPFRTRMRISPTVILYSSQTGVTGKVCNINTGGDLSASPYGSSVGFTAAVSGVTVAAQNSIWCCWTANARL